MENTPTLKKKIFKETLIYSVGSFGSKILSFLLVPFYTFFLTKKELGEYDLIITTISLFVPLVSLQISDATYRWLIKNSDKKNNDNHISKIISNSLISYLACFLIFLMGYCIFIQYINVEYSIYFIILLFTNGLIPFFHSFLRGLGKTKEFAKNGIITAFLIFLFNLIFIYLFNLKVEGILLANIIANILALLILNNQLMVHRHISFSVLDKSFIKKMLQYSLPLIPNLMSWWLIGSASKFIILHYLGTESNGIYAISSRFPSLLVIINSVLVLPLQDVILKEVSKIEDYKDLLTDFFKIEFSFVLLLVVFSPIFTKFVVSDGFYDSWKYMGLLFIGVGLNTLGAILGLFYQKSYNTMKITLTTLVGAIISIGLSFFIIEEYGLMGLSYAYMFGFFIMFIIRFLDTKSEFKLNISVFHILFSMCILVGTNHLIQQLTFLYQISIAVIASIIILYINKKFFINVFRKIR